MDEHLEHRNFDKKSIKFQNKEQGRIIKSLRKFGIEVEMYNTKLNNLVTLSKSISRAFGVEHDGSIQSEGHNVEIVSPILQGALGEQTVHDLFSNINALDFKVNKTCGFHVHLDGQGFSNDRQITVSRVADANAETFSKVKREDIVFVLKKEIMHRFIRATALEPDDVASLIAEERSNGSKQIFLSKTLGVSVPELKVRESSILSDKQEITLEMIEEINSKNTEFTFNPQETRRVITKKPPVEPEPDDYLCIIHPSKNLENLLTLIYLHTVYSDVFKAMLPESRRSGNGFCQDVALGFSAKQLETISSYAELESVWYSEKNASSIRRRKNERYDDSRYFSMNLHSLFAKYGTVEIRSHSGTLDPLKVLYWTALHQEIMDKIANGEVTIDSLRVGATLYGVEEKLPVLLDILNLRTALRKYVIQRVEYFNKK